MNRISYKEMKFLRDIQILQILSYKKIKKRALQVSKSTIA